MPSQSTRASRQLTAARLFAVTALCLVPVSTAGTNIACGLFAACLLLAPEFWRGLPLLPRHGASLAALLLLGALIISVSYTVAPHHEAWGWVGKYRKLLLLPLAVIAFKDSGWAPAVRYALFGTLTLIVVLSTSNYLGLTQIGPAYLAHDPETHAWVFKNRIAAGMFGVLLFYLAADMALRARERRVQWASAAVATLSLINVLVMLQGRTGQVIALPFVLLVALRCIQGQRKRSPGRAMAMASVLVVGAGVLLGIAFTMHGGRLLEVRDEVRQYEHSNAVTSSGLRLEFYRKSLLLIAQRPLAGFGAAGLGTEFEQMTRGKTEAAGQMTYNPHNEYLLMAVQLGAVGLLLFLNLLLQIARGAARLDGPSRHLLLAWLAIFTAGCLANSLLLDFAEGHMMMLLGGILLGCGYRGAKSPAAPIPN